MTPARTARLVRWGVPLLLLVPFPGLGQEPVAGPPSAGDTLDLVFEREIFNYPTFQRRNPFRPLSGADSGPRFEDLVLLGVIVSGNRAGSIATVGERPPGSGQQAPSRTHRLREGQVLGNTRILEIRDQVVLVQVEEFGLFELRSLELRRVDPDVEPPAPPTPQAPAPQEPGEPSPGEPLPGVPPAGQPDPGTDPGVPVPPGSAEPPGFPEEVGVHPIPQQDAGEGFSEQRPIWSGERS
jgi:hypothetical protein